MVVAGHKGMTVFDADCRRWPFFTTSERHTLIILETPRMKTTGEQGYDGRINEIAILAQDQHRHEHEHEHRPESPEDDCWEAWLFLVLLVL